MVRPRRQPRRSRPTAEGAYVLIVRGSDGRPRFERFDDVAAYRARIDALEESDGDVMSIDEIAGLLDV